MRVSHEPINWMWIPVLSMALNLLVGYLASFLFKRPHSGYRLAGLTLRRVGKGGGTPLGTP